MIKLNRFVRTLFGFILLTFFGFYLYLALNLDQSCTTSLQPECLIQWGVTLAAITGGFLGTETWFKKKIREDNSIKNEDDESLDLVTWSLLRSTLQAVGLIVLSVLPLIIAGAIAITILGVGFGFSLSIITRGLTNRLPP